MRLKNVLIVVKDIEKSKKFYKELFGLNVIQDNDGTVILSEGLVLQDAQVWSKAINQNVDLKCNSTLLYFEESDMDNFMNKLSKFSEQISYVTEIAELSWGQRLVRFYDMDGHLIEVRTPGISR